MSEVVPFVSPRAPFNLILTLDHATPSAGQDEVAWLAGSDATPLLTALLTRLCKASAPSRLVVVAHRRHSCFGARMVAGVMGSTLPASTYRWMDDTAGPAASVMLGIATLRSEEVELPLFILSPQALLDGRDLGAAATRISGGLRAWVDTFPSDNPAFDQVALRDDGRVSSIFRQPPLTVCAASGPYGFRTAATYRVCISAERLGPAPAFRCRTW